jgi:hypothetical protein
VDGARDSSWRRRCFTRLYLATKHSQVGVNVDGLAYPLHHPMICGCQTRGHGFPSGAALSHRTAVGGGTFPWGGGVKATRFGYLM